jgi:dTMP kinase
MDEINRMNGIATGNLKPDKTLLFDAPVEILLQRAKNRNEADRLEQETVAFYQSVREHYLALAAAEPERFVVLDAAQSPDAVFAQMMDALPDQLIPKALPPC